MNYEIMLKKREPSKLFGNYVVYVIAPLRMFCGHVFFNFPESLPCGTSIPDIDVFWPLEHKPWVASKISHFHEKVPLLKIHDLSLLRYI